MTTPVKKILMVDDEPEHINSYVEALKDEGYQVVQVPSVDEGFNLLKFTAFDLIILDMLMPPSKSLDQDIEELDLRQSGIWLYRAIRKDLKLLDVPIIFITAVRDDVVRDKAGEIEQQYTGRNVVFLTKPVRLNDLVTTVQGSLK